MFQDDAKRIITQRKTKHEKRQQLDSSTCVLHNAHSRGGRGRCTRRSCRTDINEVAVMRHKIELILSIIHAFIAMPLARGYTDAGIIFGDLMVAALAVICAECIIKEVKERT